MRDTPLLQLNMWNKWTILQIARKELRGEHHGHTITSIHGEPLQICYQ